MQQPLIWNSAQFPRQAEVQRFCKGSQKKKKKRKENVAGMGQVLCHCFTTAYHTFRAILVPIVFPAHHYQTLGSSNLLTSPYVQHSTLFQVDLALALFVLAMSSSNLRTTSSKQTDDAVSVFPRPTCHDSVSSCTSFGYFLCMYDVGNCALLYSWL